LLSKRAAERPTATEAFGVLQRVAQQMGEQPYLVNEFVRRTDENRLVKWVNWANTYARFGRYEEALARNERALALAPTDVEVLITQGNILGNIGLAAVRAGREEEGRLQQEAALACYDKALEVAPPDDALHRKSLYNMRGARLNEMGRYGEAEPEYIESLRLMPESAVAWRNRAINALEWGEAEARAGRREEAHRIFQMGLSHVEQAQRYAPNDARLPPLRAALQQALGDL
jgi:tetratricopeptide (TPR) repeat protein